MFCRKFVIALRKLEDALLKNETFSNLSSAELKKETFSKLSSADRGVIGEMFRERNLRTKKIDTVEDFAKASMEAVKGELGDIWKEHAAKGSLLTLPKDGKLTGIIDRVFPRQPKPSIISHSAAHVGGKKTDSLSQ